MTELREQPTEWSAAVGDGGHVCAVETPDGICGVPVEDEPCRQHPPYPLDDEHCRWIEAEDRIRDE